jgi:hypothetical protein
MVLGGMIVPLLSLDLNNALPDCCPPGLLALT